MRILQSLRSSTSARWSLRRAEARTQGELRKAKAKLAEARRVFRSGGYSGHPEEQLEFIEDRQRRVNRISAAIFEKRILDWDEIDASIAARRDFYDIHGFEELRTTPSLRTLEDKVHERVDEAWESDLGQPAQAPGLPASRDWQEAA